MTCEEILQTVRGFCARESLLEGRRQIALAVSGGADSMALLCLMRPLAEENGITLTVCHVNHGLRGETADRDEAFVREACARLGLPLRVFHAAELEAEVGRPQAGEDWARRLRYACFGRLLAEGIDAVATAHTGSDQAETLLFRLARTFVYLPDAEIEASIVPVVEALRAGLPMVLSDTRLNREAAGDAAVYVDPEAVGEVAAALENVLWDETFRSEMRRRERRRAELFSEYAVARRLIDIYTSL